MTVYETILEQLGGRMFVMMTGAKQFVHSNNGNTLTFKIGRNAGKVNCVQVNYNEGLDLYEMTFKRVSVKGIKIIKEFDQVYFDQLQTLFTEVTGMYTSL